MDHQTPSPDGSGGDVWPDLLKVCRYLQKNPRPGIYAREAPAQISTKFIEENKEILDLLLQQVFLALPSRRNGESFEDRYGFRSDEPCVRFKVLNKDLRISLGLIASDIAVPVSEARDFSWNGISVIIIENKMTFLSLPELPNTLSIWGGGGAARLLASLTWLQNCRVIYWGDIDTHGFHIVSRLRGGSLTLRPL